MWRNVEDRAAAIHVNRLLIRERQAQLDASSICLDQIIDRGHASRGALPNWRGDRQADFLQMPLDCAMRLSAHQTLFASAVVRMVLSARDVSGDRAELRSVVNVTWVQPS